MTSGDTAPRRVLRFMETRGMLPPPGGEILCAVSGGADSMCLLSLLRELLPQQGFTLSAAHFNHRLRGAESDRDEAFVRSFCEERDIPLFTGAGDVRALAAREGLGLEEAARLARYEFLEQTAREKGLPRVATAHNADDNLETVILNLARGAGLRGLAGIPPVRGVLIRPLLPLTRREIEDYNRENGVAFVTDSTNLLDDYARNRVRHRVLPVLRELNPAAAENALRASLLLREDDGYLTRLARDFIVLYGEGRSLPCGELTALPRPVASRAVRLMAAPSRLEDTHVRAVLALSAAASPSASCDLPGLRVRREYGRLLFGAGETPAMPLSPVSPGSDFELYPGGPRVTCENLSKAPDINNKLNILFFKPDSICGKIFVGSRLPGDEIRLQGRGVTKSLRKLFIEAKIPREKRGLVPVFRDNRGVIGVGGFGADERAAAEPGEAALKIELIEGKV